MYLFTEAKKLDLRLALQLSSSTDKDEKSIGKEDENKSKFGTQKDNWEDWKHSKRCMKSRDMSREKVFVPWKSHASITNSCSIL